MHFDASSFSWPPEKRSRKEGSGVGEVILTMEQWNQFIDEFERSEVVAVDIETTGLDCEVPEGEINSIQFSLDSTDKN